MQNAIRLKSQEAYARVEIVINDMMNANQPVTFNQVANLAWFSKGWLYSQNDLCIKIKDLRARNKNVGKLITNASVFRRDAIIANLRTRITKLETENNELRKQLEVVYGQLHLK